MRTISFIISSLFILINSLSAQRNPYFSALLVNPEGEPLIGATANWTDTTINSVADANGWIKIPRLDTINPYNLEINYVGYETAIIEILPEEDRLQIVVKNNVTLQEIKVETDEKGNFTSTLNATNIETIHACELKRAACCSLAESFETNGTVNVSSSDAVTGTKDIEMLGLRGTYVQMQIENRPALNRLDRAYGMEFIPGSWIENIQISKGASSVRNGVQGITGQINVELLKPNKAPLFFVNLYANHVGRFELNTNLNIKINNKLAMGLLAHGNYFSNSIDHNHDGYLDVPQKQQINVLNRWLYQDKDWHIEFNVHGLLDKRAGGQTAKTIEHLHDKVNTFPYGVNSDIQRLEGFGKVGYVGSPKPRESVAVMYSGLLYNQRMQFGDRLYNAAQRSAYINLIYQNRIINDNHNLNVGLNYALDDLREEFMDITLNRTQQLAAAYAEYDFSKKLAKKEQSIGLILGGRFDTYILNNKVHFYPSPRVNFKFNFSDNTIVRASAGRGVRLPNALMENVRYMPSLRSFELQGTINPEVAWNYGINLTHSFYIGSQEGSFNIDAYRTDFENQLVADIDTDNSKVLLYNLNGKSYANSLLITYNQDIVKGLSARVAYKFNDVHSTYKDTLRLVPFTPQHRGLLTVKYVTPNKAWQFDVTAQYVGKQRLPHVQGNTDGLPNYRIQAKAPDYVILLAQISRVFKNGLGIYAGAENLTNYKQPYPILGSNDPFGQQNSGAKFDASSVFAPVMGIMIYGGFRYSFTPKEKEKEAKMNIFTAKTEVQQIEIKTSAQCGMCKTSIERKLLNVKGVQSATLDMDSKVLKINYVAPETTPDYLRKVISGLGYDADEVPANPEVYKKLPACCQK